MNVQRKNFCKKSEDLNVNRSVRQIRANENGFTLVEVLAALTIFAIVGLATVTLMQRAIAARTAAKRATEQLMQTRQALSTLTSDLSSVQSFSLGPFQGNPDSLGFTVCAKYSNGVELLRYVAYFLESSGNSEYKKLVRSTLDFYGNREVEVLLPEVASMQVLYLQQQNHEARWIERWSDSEGLPLAVHVTILEPSAQEPMEIICPIRTHERITAKETE